MHFFSSIMRLNCKGFEMKYSCWLANFLHFQQLQNDSSHSHEECVCPQAGCKWQLASCNHPSMNCLQLSQASEQCDEVLHSNCTEIKFQNGLCSVTPHSLFPSLPLFNPFPTTSLQDTWRAIASQHIPGSLTQRAMAAQFAFNKQLNRNKKPLREEYSKSATEREGERESENNAVWEERCDIDLFNNYNKT